MLMHILMICLLLAPLLRGTVYNKQLFQKLDDYGIFINPAKCTVGVSSLDCLGHFVNSNGTTPLSAKVQAIQDLPPPTTLRKLREVLGLINFLSAVYT